MKINRKIEMIPSFNNDKSNGRFRIVTKKKIKKLGEEAANDSIKRFGNKK